MKINSKDLFNYINNLKSTEKIRFKVYYDDCYITEIFWDGENFNWESGHFTSGSFFDPHFDFEIIGEDRKIEKLDLSKFSEIINYIISPQEEKIQNKINELIDEVNKLKNGGK